MTKRILCFLTAAVLVLLPWTAPAEEEEEEECLHKHKDTVGYVAPAVNVPGYSGDYVCLDCHAVLRKGNVLPALEAPAGEAMDGSLDKTGGSVPTKAVPARPATPAAPKTPTVLA